VAATSSAVPSAVQPAVSPDWLQVDTSAAQKGEAPASYGYPRSDAPQTPVPTVDSGLPQDYAPSAPDSPAYLNVGEAGENPVPTMYGLDAQGVIDRAWSSPQGELETTLPQTEGSGFWAGSEPLQTYDHLSQHTDTAGWDQTVPNNRVSARNTWGQWNPVNSPTDQWEPSENAVQAHLAITSPGFTSDPGQPGVIGVEYGSLPDWTVEASSPYAYETPSPAAGVPAPTQYAPDPAAGWA